MRFQVRHETVYSYAAPVTLAAHRVRLSPRADAGRILSRELICKPAPIVRREVEDAHGNLSTLLEFEGSTDLLRLESRFDLQTQSAPIVKSPLMPLPWALPDETLRPYLVDVPVSPSVAAFAANLGSASQGAPLGFLDALTQTLFIRTDRRIRETGYAQTPDETLARGQGACRDLTVLFLACCRHFGMPGRFASGYQAQAESVDGQRHLHAWPEVWVPGTGWLGFDPTHGTRVTDGHVVLCAAPRQEETMPVEGGYYGPPTGARLDYRIDIVAL